MKIFENVKHYPKYVYSKYENVTRENMRKYDENERKFYATLDKLYPDYYKGNYTREEKNRMYNHVVEICNFIPEL